MNHAARIVPSLTDGHTARITAVDTKLNGTVKNGTVAVARMSVAPAGASGSNRDGKHDGFLIGITLESALEQ